MNIFLFHSLGAAPSGKTGKLVILLVSDNHVGFVILQRPYNKTLKNKFCTLLQLYYTLGLNVTGSCDIGF